LLLQNPLDGENLDVEWIERRLNNDTDLIARQRRCEDVKGDIIGQRAKPGIKIDATTGITGINV
jgi:hypothetical protein